MVDLTKIAMEMDWLQDPLSWLFVASVVFVVLRLRRRDRAPPLPPGPNPLPIVGNMSMMDQLTHRGLAALAKKYGGFLHLRLGKAHVFAVSTPEYAREVLHVQDGAFLNRPASIAATYLTYDRADMAFAHYGPFWRQMRKLCVMKLFSRRRPDTWLAVRDESAALVRAVARRSGETVNLGELIFNLAKNVTFRAAFGAGDGGKQEEFVAILQEFSKLFAAFCIGDFIPWLSWADPQGINVRLRTARAALDQFIDKIIDEHMMRGRNPDDADADMVDGMLAFLPEARPNKTAGDGREDLQNTLRLTRDNIKAMIMDVMFGGTETVASAIEWAMAEMMHYPDDLRRLQQELADTVGLDRNVNESDLDKLPFLKCVIKETLRLHPPIPMLNHENAEDCVVDGYSVPRGSRVIINVFAIGRDINAWKDPDMFRPSRFMAGEGEAAGVDFKGGCFEFLPFGSGRRSCPGMALGLYSLELAVAQLAHGFNWELPNDMKPSELDMSDVFGLTVPRATRLCVVPTPRLTCSLVADDDDDDDARQV
ncbi:cytochrome P450 84A1 [Hordeum vulgare]|uniref:cytochrome P450 84A1-like n=1 Tax=Hordeum vulgare subsp. vulgare TaxID=112509 RepID=UPI001B84E1DB|nr:cytochrome P450 84A1-like [Hordeum vulgare subsp. vulgare]KAE8782125.1 cytochrome P450 84A1 [Hordeum vulgare]